MNKKERHILKELKYKKRLRQLQLENQKGNFFAYKSHGKPCSCKWCRDSKYRETRHTEKIAVLNGEIRESCGEFCQCENPQQSTLTNGDVKCVLCGKLTWRNSQERT